VSFLSMLRRSDFLSDSHIHQRIFLGLRKHQIFVSLHLLQINMLLIRKLEDQKHWVAFYAIIHTGCSFSFLETFCFGCKLNIASTHRASKLYRFVAWIRLRTASTVVRWSLSAFPFGSGVRAALVCWIMPCSDRQLLSSFPVNSLSLSTVYL
jgi:hypothetical protein